MSQSRDEIQVISNKECQYFFLLCVNVKLPVCGVSRLNVSILWVKMADINARDTPTDFQLA